MILILHVCDRVKAHCYAVSIVVNITNPYNTGRFDPRIFFSCCINTTSICVYITDEEDPRIETSCIVWICCVNNALLTFLLLLILHVHCICF